MKIRAIHYLGGLSEVNTENGNLDVHVELEDGRVFSIVVATPNNITWCMDNEGIDYYFGTPVVFVRLLRRDYIDSALEAIILENNGMWLELYGSLQE
jgi:hypothetical protein